MKIKIGFKLASIIFLVSALIMLTVVLIAFQIFTNALKEQVFERLADNSFHTIDKLDGFMFERLADIKLWTSELNSLYGGNIDDVKEELDFLRGEEKIRKVYASISIYDVNGFKIGDTKGLLINSNEKDKPFFKEAIKGNFYYDSKPIISESLGIPVVHFSGPLRDNNGNIIGVLATRFPISRVNELLEGGSLIHEKLKKEGHSKVDIDLLDNDGLIVYSTDDKEDILKKRLSGLEIFKKIKNSDNLVETLLGKHEEHEALFVAVKEQGYLDYKGNGWILLLHIHPDAAFAPVQNFLKTALIAVFAVLILAVPLSIFLSKKITKPIIKLRNAADEISRGQLDKRIEIKSNDELGELADSFDNMRYSLRMVIEEYENTSEKLKGEKQKIEGINKTLNQSSVVSATDKKGAITYANEMFTKIAKYSEDELIGKNHRIINSGFHTRNFFKNLWKTISNGGVWHGYIRNKAKDSSIYWVKSTLMPLFDKDGKIAGYNAVRTPVTDLFRQIEEAYQKERNGKKISKDMKRIIEELREGTYKGYEWLDYKNGRH